MRSFHCILLVLLLPISVQASDTILCAPPPPPHSGGGHCSPGPGTGGGTGDAPPGHNQQNMVVGIPTSISVVRTPASALPADLLPAPKISFGGGTYACLVACAVESVPGPAGQSYLQLSLQPGAQHLLSSFMTLLKPAAFAAGAELPFLEIELALADGRSAIYSVSLMRRPAARLLHHSARSGESNPTLVRAGSGFDALLRLDGQLLQVLEVRAELGRQQQLPLSLLSDASQSHLELDLGAGAQRLTLPAEATVRAVRLGRLTAAPELLPEARSGLWFFDLRLSRDGKDVQI